MNDTQQVLQHLVARLQRNEVDEAASLYSRLSEDVGYFLVQKAPGDPAMRMRLAKMFFVAKDFEKAALVFEQAGDFEKAARLYEKADNYGMAAEMYAQVEAWDKAAQMYEKHGNFATAAQLYQQVGDLARAAANFEKAVNNFLAGQMYYELGKYDKAVELLQKIGPEDPNHVEASVLVNKVLAATGYRTIAIRKLAAIVEQQGLNEQTLDVALTLAENLVAEAELDQAKDWLHRIAEVRFPYRHAGDLLKQIEAGEVEVVEMTETAQILDEEAAAEEIDTLEPLEDVEDTGPVVAAAAGFDAIRDATLFQELNLQELRKFWMLVETREVPDGEVLIEQDTEGQGLFIVGEGKVRVLRVDDNGNEEQLAELGPGAHLGEMSLMDETPTSARVRTLGEAKIYFMPKDAFHRLIDTDDRLARKVYQAFAATLMDRLRDTNARFKSFKEKKQSEMADLFGIKA